MLATDRIYYIAIDYGEDYEFFGSWLEHINVDGTNRTRLTTLGDHFDEYDTLAISPNGDRIIYSQYTDWESDDSYKRRFVLWGADFPSFANTHVIHDPGYRVGYGEFRTCQYPLWLTNNRIAFSTYHVEARGPFDPYTGYRPRNKIVEIDFDGTDAVDTLVGGGPVDNSPFYNPDYENFFGIYDLNVAGDRAYVGLHVDDTSEPGVYPSSYLVDYPGDGDRYVLSEPHEIFESTDVYTFVPSNFRKNPSRTKMAYVNAFNDEDLGAVSYLELANLDLTSRVVLATAPSGTSIDTFCWSGDGSHIAYIVSDHLGSTWELHVVAKDGTGDSTVLSLSGDQYGTNVAMIPFRRSGIFFGQIHL